MTKHPASILDINGLSKTYGQNQALTDLHLSLESGQIYGLLGENGAGKTTTLQIIVGIIEKTSGSVDICGISIDSHPVQAKKNCFYIPDHAVLFENMRGNRYLEWMCQIYEVNYREAYTRQDDLISAFGLVPHLEKEIGEMSLGTKQKLLLTAGLMINPPLLILDEPMVGLDATSILLMKESLQNFACKGGAVLFSTHLLHIAQNICSHVFILKEGKEAFQTKMSELTEDLEHVFMGVMSG